MAENRFKACQQKRAVEEESRLEQAKGGTTSVSGKIMEIRKWFLPSSI